MGSKQSFLSLRKEFIYRFSGVPITIVNHDGTLHKRWKISIHKGVIEVDDQDNGYTPERPLFFNQLSNLIDDEDTYSGSGTTCIKFDVIFTLETLEEGEIDFKAFCKGHIIVLDGYGEEVERTDFFVLFP
jgi:hypothetical protein